MGWPGFPTLDEACELQLELVQWLGGEAGVNEFDKLDTVLSMVGQGHYQDLTLQAADLLRSIARNRCFYDANKRMSLALVSRFLSRNGRELRVGDREAARFVAQDVIQKEANLQEIAEWIQAHSRSAR
jgi:death-on-curing family protein